MLPTTVGLDGNAVFSGFIDLAAGLEGESSHGVNRTRWVGGGEFSAGAADRRLHRNELALFWPVLQL